MQKLETLVKKINEVNNYYLMSLLFSDKDFTNLIIKLNRDNQLYERGIDANGQSLGEYSPVTVYMKLFFRNPVQVVDRITLKDTGEFYKSFATVKLNNGDIKIYADTQKEDGDLRDRYGDILGLTEENMSILINTAKQVITKQINLSR